MIARGTRSSATYSDNFAYEPATLTERYAALALMATLIVSTGAILPFASRQFPAIPAILIFVESIAILALALTSSMLFSQYRARRYAPLAVLSIAFAAYALIHVIFIATFPGVFSTTGLGAGPQTAAWATTMGKLLFASLVIVFVYGEWRAHQGAIIRTKMLVRIAAGVFALVFVVAMALTLGHAWLPPIMTPQGHFSPLYYRLIEPLIIVSNIAAIVALVAVGGLRNRVSVWLMITLLLNMLEAATAGSISGARYTLGWYFARFDLLVSSTLFIIVMHAQLTGILQRSARASTRAHQLFKVSSTTSDVARESNQALVDAALLELDYEWGFVVRLEDGHATIETSVGATPYERDARSRLESALLHGAMSRELFVMDSGSGSPASESFAWASFASVPIFADGKLYGAVGFASKRRRKTPLTDADRDFLYLIGILAGSAIERERRASRLSGLAFFDSLTGLPNRASLLEKLKDRLAIGERYGTPFAVHFLDLDLFKPINDRFGHAVGDEVLREVARRLRELVPEGDTVARLGGDEFVVLQHLASDTRESENLSQRMSYEIEENIETSAGAVRLGVSIGIALYPRDGVESLTLLARADEAQYRTKSTRRRTLAEATQFPRVARPLAAVTAAETKLKNRAESA